MTLAARVAETGNRNRLLFDPTDSLLSSVWPTFPPQNVVVAICRNLPCDFVADIMALDGQVAGLLLLAPSLPATTVIDLMVQVGATILRTDRADLTALNVPHARPAVMAAATAWYLTTSGTTGIPKIVRHTLANLTRSVQASNKDEPPRWGLLYEPSRFAGLQVVLQSLIGGGVLLAPDPNTSLVERLKFIVANGCTHLSATPTLWRQLLMLPEVNVLALRQITLGGEIADAGLLRMLASRFPTARISHIYASTETGVGFSVRDGSPGFPAIWLSQGIGNVALKIVDGVLWVRASVDGNAGSGVHIVCDDDGYMCTGDLVRRIGSRIVFLGRGDSVINVGGIKVYPEDVEAIVNAHPEVAGCRISAKPNPILGAILGLTVVPHITDIDAVAFRVRLNGWLRERLPREAQPATIRIVAALEITAAGKIPRNKI